MNNTPGYNIDEMHEIQKELNDYFVPFVGDDPEKFANGETEVPGLNYVIGYASAGRVMMLPEANSRQQVEALKQVVTEKIKGIPGVIAFASRGSIFSSNTGGTRSINLELSGTDLVGLFDAGFKFDSGFGQLVGQMFDHRTHTVFRSDEHPVTSAACLVVLSSVVGRQLRGSNQTAKTLLQFHESLQSCSHTQSAGIGGVDSTY